MANLNGGSPWGYREIPFPTGLTLVQLFEKQAELHPDKTALIFRDQKLTYRDLNEKTNQLARYLKTLGIGQESLVVVCMERSLDIYIALLAIQKAGGAYVPFEPSNPTDRLDFLFTDSNPKAILTQSPIVSRLPKKDKPIFCIDTDWHNVEQESTKNLPPQATEDNLSDVIYTSGSTGMPKGVMNMHKNRVNQFFAWKEAYGISESDVFFQTTSYAFDVFTGDWTRSLCNGATLVPSPSNLAMLPELPVEEIYNTIKKEGVTFVEFLATALRKFFNYVKANQLPLDFLKYIVVGSDAWYMHEFKELRAYCGVSTRHINSYGMTEEAVDSTYFEASMVKDLNDPRYESNSPIGRPFANTRVYLFDKNMELVPAGEIGEMYFGGPNTARGYLNRSELNAERFIQNPLTSEKDILYKSGDLARVNEGGVLEFCGRSDFQIEVGSKRIEVQEIESGILAHPAVRETVVTGVRASDRDMRIVAYVVCKPRMSVTDDKLREFLKKSLPGYMVPHYIIMLHEFPLNGNGKVDRKKLPAVEVR